MQKVELFKPEDFVQEYGRSERCYIEFAAKTANDVLNKYIESCPVVYGTKHDSTKGWGFDQQGIIEGLTTHTARLAFIEELPKEKPKVSDDLDFLNKLINSPESVSTEDLIRKTGEYLINEVIKHFKKEGTL